MEIMLRCHNAAALRFLPDWRHRVRERWQGLHWDCAQLAAASSGMQHGRVHGPTLIAASMARWNGPLKAASSSTCKWRLGMRMSVCMSSHWHTVLTLYFLTSCGWQWEHGKSSCAHLNPKLRPFTL